VATVTANKRPHCSRSASHAESHTAGAKEHRASYRQEQQFGWQDLERGKKQLCLLKLQQMQINHYSAEFPVQKEAGAIGSSSAKFGLNPSQI